MMASKDAEARIRALTREVGTLRENLRRESKLREQAVCQSQEHKEARQAADEACHELEYRSRKLGEQLESVQAAARAASDRDRKALRALRDGLAGVEGAVAERSQKGFHQVQKVFEQLHSLRTLLFLPTQLGAALQPLAPGVAPEAGALLSDAVQGLSQLAELLTGPAPELSTSTVGTHRGAGTAAPGAPQAPASAPGATAAASGGPPGGGGLGVLMGLLRGSVAVGEGAGGQRDENLALERSALLDELVRLRAELRAALERNESSTTATALELQQALVQSRGDMSSLQSELLRLQAELQRSGLECGSLQQQVADLQHRLAQRDSGSSELLAMVQQQDDASLARIAALQAGLVALQDTTQRQQQHIDALQGDIDRLQQENALLASRLSVRERDVEGALQAASANAERAAQLQATIDAQQADIRNAMALIAAPTARHSSTTAVVSRLRDRPTSAGDLVGGSFGRTPRQPLSVAGGPLQRPLSSAATSAAAITARLAGDPRPLPSSSAMGTASAVAATPAAHLHPPPLQQAQESSFPQAVPQQATGDGRSAGQWQYSQAGRPDARSVTAVDQALRALQAHQRLASPTHRRVSIIPTAPAVPPAVSQSVPHWAVTSSHSPGRMPRSPPAIVPPAVPHMPSSVSFSPVSAARYAQPALRQEPPPRPFDYSASNHGHHTAIAPFPGRRRYPTSPPPTTTFQLPGHRSHEASRSSAEAQTQRPSSLPPGLSNARPSAAAALRGPPSSDRHYVTSTFAAGASAEGTNSPTVFGATSRDHRDERSGAAYVVGSTSRGRHNDDSRSEAGRHDAPQYDCFGAQRKLTSGPVTTATPPRYGGTQVRPQSRQQYSTAAGAAVPPPLPPSQGYQGSAGAGRPVATTAGLEQRRQSGGEDVQDIDQLRRHMATLDEEMALLDAQLQATSRRA